MSLPALYHLAEDVRAVLDDDLLSPEQAEAALDALLPAIQTKVAGVCRWIEYQEDLAAAIKEREKQVIEARKAMESRAERWRAYLLRCMELAEASEVVDRETGITVKVKQNPPSVIVDDEAAIPEDYLVQPPPPPPRPDKKLIGQALKDGYDVPGCRLVRGQRLEIK